MSRFLVADRTVDDTLHRIAEITLEAVPRADIAGMSMLDELGTPTTSVFTDEVSPAIDAEQYRTRTGPCLEAWRTKSVIRVDDMDLAAATYPAFSDAARAHGVLSTLSLPLVNADTGVGALNLYARRAQAFTEDDEQVGLDLATTAAAVLANVSAFRSAFELGEHLVRAMESRGVIEQAKGWLMARTPDLDADGAFDVLRRASQRENRKLRDIAAEIVDGRRPVEPEAR